MFTLRNVVLLLMISLICSQPYGHLPSGFWKIEVGQFDPVNGDIVFALADFNQDRFTDIVTVDSWTTSKITINLWNMTTNTFVKRVLNGTMQGGRIVSIMASDFNYDGQTDLMVVWDLGNSFNAEIRILRDCQTMCKAEVWQPTGGMLTQLDMVEPFLIDLDGNRKPDVFFVKGGTRYIMQVEVYVEPPPPPPIPTPDNNTNPDNNPENNTTPENNTEPSVQKSKQQGTLKNGDLIFKQTLFKDYITRPQPQTEEQVIPQIVFQPLENHYASLIDWSGDCMADLVMFSLRNGAYCLEFYKALGNGNLSEPKIYSLSTDVKSFSFTDSNFDGAVDLVLLYQEMTGPAYLEVHHNLYPSKMSQLCLENSNFPFDMGELIDGTMKKIQRYQLAGRLSDESIPVLRFADLNSDGYPDLLINLMTALGEQPLSSNPYIYYNQQCINQTCGTYNPAYTFYANVTNMRYYNPLRITTFNLTNIRSFAAYDFFQDGKQDFIINYYQIKKNKPKTYFVAAIINNNPIDAFSLKLLTINGHPSQSKATTSMFGVTYELKVTSLSGQFRHAVANQQFQLSHQALQSPNVIIGLGRTNNYVQDLTVGMMQNSTPHTRTWTPIVPHTQLIIIPSTRDRKNWQISIYIEPTEKIRTVFTFTLLSLVLIGLLIYYFHNKQKTQDRQNMTNFYTLLR